MLPSRLLPQEAGFVRVEVVVSFVVNKVALRQVFLGALKL
jgi:hypothetical protein